MPGIFGKIVSAVKQVIETEKAGTPQVEAAPEPQVDNEKERTAQYIRENQECEKEIRLAIDELRDELPQLVDDQERAQKLNGDLKAIYDALSRPLDIPMDLSEFNELAKSATKDMRMVLDSAELEQNEAYSDVFDVNQCMEMLSTALCKNRRSQNPLELSVAKNRLVVVQYSASLASYVRQLDEQGKKLESYNQRLAKLYTEFPGGKMTPAAAAEVRKYNVMATEIDQFIESVKIILADLRGDIEYERKLIREAEAKINKAVVDPELIKNAVNELEAAHKQENAERLNRIKESEEKIARKLAELKSYEEELAQVAPVITWEEERAIKERVEALNAQAQAAEEAVAQPEEQTEAPVAETVDDDAMVEEQ